MRGSVLELVIIFAILGTLMFGGLIALLIYNEFTERDVWGDTEAGQAAQAGAEGAVLAIDYGIAFVLMGLIISMIVSSLFIKTHPIFFVISLILLIFVILVSGVLSNAFIGVASSDSFANEVDSFSISTHIVGNFPLIAVIAGFVVMIALYAKPGDGGNI